LFRGRSEYLTTPGISIVHSLETNLFLESCR